MMVRDIDVNMPFQYLWVLGGSATPTVKHKVTIETEGGVPDIAYAQEGKRKTVVIVPDEKQGYALPPNTITLTPPTAAEYHFYDDYTGAVVLINVTMDVKITGKCRKMVHTHDEIKTQPYEHDDLNKYFLTHDKIKGPVVP